MHMRGFWPKVTELVWFVRLYNKLFQHSNSLLMKSSLSDGLMIVCMFYFNMSITANKQSKHPHNLKALRPPKRKKPFTCNKNLPRRRMFSCVH